jgi:hypothetical protein
MSDGWTADTSVRRQGCSAQDLLVAVQQVVDEYPEARLVRNQVGNLAVLVGMRQVGALDLTFGQFDAWDRPSDES